MTKKSLFPHPQVIINTDDDITYYKARYTRTSVPATCSPKKIRTVPQPNFLSLQLLTLTYYPIATEVPADANAEGQNVVLDVRATPQVQVTPSLSSAQSQPY